MPRISKSPSRFTLDALRYRTASQLGQSSSVLVIFIFIVLFAIMLTGGYGMLFSGDTPTPDQWAVSGTPSAGGSGGGTATTSAVVTWKLTVNLKGCVSTPTAGESIEVLPEGPGNGYLSYEVEVTPGSFLTTVFNGFTGPKQAFTYILPNSRGYNTKKWRVELFEGGTANGSTYSGGTSKSVVNYDATGCQ